MRGTGEVAQRAASYRVGVWQMDGAMQWRNSRREIAYVLLQMVSPEGDTRPGRREVRGSHVA